MLTISSLASYFILDAIRLAILGPGLVLIAGLPFDQLPARIAVFWIKHDIELVINPNAANLDNQKRGRGSLVKATV